MHGGTEGILIPVLIISVLATITDLWRGKIYNALTFPAMLIGIASLTSRHGLGGFGASLAGIGVGLLAYGWMFWRGAMGAGDVKLLMALGAWGGSKFALKTALLGLFIGGAMAIVQLVIRGRIRSFAERARTFLLSLWVKELERQAFQVDTSQTMPYALPIGIAAVWIAWADPLARWGLL